MATRRVNGRAKGSRGEREAAKYLAKLGFNGARRGVQYKGGADSPDVICTDLAGVHIEVKRREDIHLGTEALTSAIEQAIADANGQPWAVLWKRNRTPWYITFQAGKPVIEVTVTGDSNVRHALLWLRREAEAIPF